jgi:hypothetical protein
MFKDIIKNRDPRVDVIPDAKKPGYLSLQFAFTWGLKSGKVNLKKSTPQDNHSE